MANDYAKMMEERESAEEDVRVGRGMTKKAPPGSQTQARHCKIGSTPRHAAFPARSMAIPFRHQRQHTTDRQPVKYPVDDNDANVVLAMLAADVGSRPSHIRRLAFTSASASEAMRMKFHRGRRGGAYR